MVIQLPTLGDLDTSGMEKKGPFTKFGEFVDAVEDAQAGHLIILADGKYDISRSEIEFSNRIGTTTSSIIVKPETVGGAILNGSEGAARFRFRNCRFFTWYGFTHTYELTAENDNIDMEDKHNIVFEGGNNNRFARCEVKPDNKDPHKKRHSLQISNSKAIRVDHCFFHHKKSEGQFCNVKYRSDNEPGEGPLFEYNHFLHQDYNKIVRDDNIGDAGGEAIQMGDSKLCRYYYRGVFRYNYFEECNGDGEMITNKSSGNIYYNNSFMKTLGTMTLRHGDSTAILGNYFEACGLRVGARGNLIANNHFTKNSAPDNKPQRRPLAISTGDWKQDPSKPYSDDMQGAHWEQVVANKIILNTFANGDGQARSIVYWGVDEGDYMPTGNMFKGNIVTARRGRLLEIPEGVVINGKIEEDGEETEISNDITDNIGWAIGDAEVGNLSSDMATIDKDPLLTEDRDGIYRLQNNSPARNKLQGTPFREFTTVDIDGKDRGSNTDAGCDQFSTESRKPKKRITTEDVGPNATTDLRNSPDWSPQPINPRD
jgi:poly(beta-D-mannuronate) lyase